MLIIEDGIFILIIKIKLMLSENKPEDSIKNFLTIKENLSKTEFNNIEFIDLRNIDIKLLLLLIND